MYLDLATFALIGAVTGFLAGLLGIGGGIITTPSLFFLLDKSKANDENTMHIAIATTLACMIFSTLSSVYFHHRKKAVEWVTTKRMLFGVILGSFLGAYVSKSLPSDVLKLIFGVFLIVLGLGFILRKKAQSQGETYTPKSLFALSSISLSISFVSSMIGIGGGLFTVPTLTALGMRIQKSIATSSSISFCVAVLASIFYALFGAQKGLGAFSLGFINLKAFIAITVFSVCFAPLGVKVAHKINTKLLKRIFGGVVLIVGVYMISK